MLSSVLYYIIILFYVCLYVCTAEVSYYGRCMAEVSLFLAMVLLSLVKLPKHMFFFMLSVLSVKYRDILYYCMFVWRRYHIIAVVWRRYHFFWPWYHGEIALTHVFFVHVKYVMYHVILYYNIIVRLYGGGIILWPLYGGGITISSLVFPW